jgi:hypothetical protein
VKGVWGVFWSTRTQNTNTGVNMGKKQQGNRKQINTKSSNIIQNISSMATKPPLEVGQSGGGVGAWVLKFNEWGARSGVETFVEEAATNESKLKGHGA